MIMNVESEAKIKAKRFLLENRISKITLDNIIYIIEQQGFEIIEYNQAQHNDSAWEIIENLELHQYAMSVKAFAYQCGKTKLIFICDDMTADEKLYALAHEEGHIISEHLNTGICDSNSVEHEQLANEIAHYLLHPPVLSKVLIDILEKKKLYLTIVSSILCVVILATAARFIVKNNSYYGEYYITENGSKYHKKDCMIIKDKTNTRRLTEEDYASKTYESCQVCLPN